MSALASTKHEITMYLDKRQQRMLDQIVNAWNDKYKAGAIALPASEAVILTACAVMGMERMLTTWCLNDNNN